MSNKKKTRKDKNQKVAFETSTETLDNDKENFKMKDAGEHKDEKENDEIVDKEEPSKEKNKTSLKTKRDSKLKEVVTIEEMLEEMTSKENKESKHKEKMGQLEEAVFHGSKQTQNDSIDMFSSFLDDLYGGEAEIGQQQEANEKKKRSKKRKNEISEEGEFEIEKIAKKKKKKSKIKENCGPDNEENKEVNERMDEEEKIDVANITEDIENDKIQIISSDSGTISHKEEAFEQNSETIMVVNDISENLMISSNGNIASKEESSKQNCETLMEDTNWDIEKYRKRSEPETHWHLKRDFMQSIKHMFDEQKVVCLGQVLGNMVFMGCLYPTDVMKQVEELGQELLEKHRNSMQGCSKRTFVSGSSAAHSKVNRLATATLITKKNENNTTDKESGDVKLNAENINVDHDPLKSKLESDEVTEDSNETKDEVTEDSNKPKDEVTEDSNKPKDEVTEDSNKPKDEELSNTAANSTSAKQIKYTNFVAATKDESEKKETEGGFKEGFILPPLNNTGAKKNDDYDPLELFKSRLGKTVESDEVTKDSNETKDEELSNTAANSTSANQIKYTPGDSEEKETDGGFKEGFILPPLSNTGNSKNTNLIPEVKREGDEKDNDERKPNEDEEVVDDDNKKCDVEAGVQEDYHDPVTEEDVCIDIDNFTKVGGFSEAISGSNIGHKMLAKMGWSGGGLGQRGSGRTEPITVDFMIGRNGVGFREADGFLNKKELKALEKKMEKTIEEYLESPDVHRLVFGSGSGSNSRQLNKMQKLAKWYGLGSRKFWWGEDHCLRVWKNIDGQAESLDEVPKKSKKKKVKSCKTLSQPKKKKTINVQLQRQQEGEKFVLKAKKFIQEFIRGVHKRIVFTPGLEKKKRKVIHIEAKKNGLKSNRSGEGGEENGLYLTIWKKIDPASEENHQKKTVKKSSNEQQNDTKDGVDNDQGGENQHCISIFPLEFDNWNGHGTSNFIASLIKLRKTMEDTGSIQIFTQKENKDTIFEENGSKQTFTKKKNKHTIFEDTGSIQTFAQKENKHTIFGDSDEEDGNETRDKELSNTSDLINTDDQTRDEEQNEASGDSEEYDPMNDDETSNEQNIAEDGANNDSVNLIKSSLVDVNCVGSRNTSAVRNQ